MANQAAKPTKSADQIVREVVKQTEQSSAQTREVRRALTGSGAKRNNNGTAKKPAR